jgi:hypothetical protein
MSPGKEIINPDHRILDSITEGGDQNPPRNVHPILTSAISDGEGNSVNCTNPEDKDTNKTGTKADGRSVGNQEHRLNPHMS